MLYNETERDLMSRAVQPNMRNPNLPATTLNHIVGDFGLRFGTGSRVLDIGPGQCDLLDIARARGAETVGCDFDPAVVELGRARGHTMFERNLRHGLPLDAGRFDGIFCRGSINAYWFANTVDKLDDLLGSLAAALKDSGWMWIAPWNNPPATGLTEPDPIATRIVSWRVAHGISTLDPSVERQKRYGIGYAIPRHEIWMRNLVDR